MMLIKIKLIIFSLQKVLFNSHFLEVIRKGMTWRMRSFFCSSPSKRAPVSFFICLHSVSLFHLSDMCRKLEFQQHSRGHALKNHVFKTIFAVDEEICRLNCYLESKCISYNFDPSLVNNKHRCELSDSDHRLHPEDLQPENDFIYCTSKVSGFYLLT